MTNRLTGTLAVLLIALVAGCASTQSSSGVSGEQASSGGALLGFDVDIHVHDNPRLAHRAQRFHRWARREVERCRAHPACWVIEADWWSDPRICKSASTYYHFFQSPRMYGQGFPMSAKSCDIPGVVPEGRASVLLGHRPHGDGPVVCWYRDVKPHYTLRRGYGDCDELSLWRELYADRGYGYGY